MMKYGLIGKTLVHSYSKEIHEALGRYSYGLFSLSEDEMPKFVASRGFNGLNVTIPYKKDVIPMCDRISDLAAAIGAVNTLYWDPSPESSSRKLTGHNTDYEGFLYAARRADMDFSGKTVLILGTGGTSAMAHKAVSDEGAKIIYTASRNPKGAGHITYDRLPSVAEDIDVIINTTPVGTYPNNMQSIISLSDFPQCESVLDVIYNPFRTRLLMEAEKKGLKFSNGLPMLVAQATAAAGWFLGTPGAFESENERIIRSLSDSILNIVLIGMPGSGKSTIGKLLSLQLNRPFIDMDEEIVRRAGMSIPEIFEKYGESRFRKTESETALDIGKEHGLIIATGGGAVLKNENLAALRQNGKIIHIKRPADKLPTSGRPLSKDSQTLRKMEKERLPVYEAASDMTFDNSIMRSKNDLAAELEKFLKL